MRSIFITLFLLCLGGSFAQAANLPVPQKKLKEVIVDCPQGKCDDFLNHRSNGPVPYDQGTICSTIVQGKVSQMMVRFFDENGTEIDSGDRLHTKLAKAVGKICPGKHWFEKARLGRVEFCNEDNHKSVLKPAQIEMCLANGSCTPLPTNYVCLLGAEGCAEAKIRAAEMLRQ